MIGQRTKDALAVKREQGVRLGRRPTMPSATLAAVLHARAETRTLQQAADLLNANGVPTAHARPDRPVTKWHPSTMSKVLKAHARSVYEADRRRDRRERRR